MNYLVFAIYLFGLGFLDRLGGGGFAFIHPALPDKGWKPARRYGIPLAILALAYTSLWAILGAIILSIIFHFNLDEIEGRDWEEIALWSFAFAVALLPVCGLWAILPAGWWPLGIYLSNIGIKGFKLPWQYVELLRGSLIAIGASLGGSFG